MDRIRRTRFGSVANRFCTVLVGSLVSLGMSAAVQGQETAGSAAPAASTAEKPQESAAPAKSATPQEETKTEMSMRDAGTTFKLRVNLVQVHVVVRDEKGKPIENLKREDFIVYDQGKPQAITVFAMETQSQPERKGGGGGKNAGGCGRTGERPKSVLPDRFVALEFDDVHLTTEDAMYSRHAAEKFLDSLAPTDRVGIFTTSGEWTQDLRAISRC